MIRHLFSYFQIKWAFFSYYFIPITSSNFNMTTNSEPSKEVMDVLYANQPTSRNFTQNFQVSRHIITHEHKVQVELTPNTGQSLEIRNYFTMQTDQKLFKLTEIQFQNRIIKIIDSFEAKEGQKSDPPYQEHILENAKSCNRNVILPKRTLIQRMKEGEVFEKIKSRDTKNVVKNIIRLFLAWIQESIPSHKQVYELLTEMIRNGRYNNHLIINLSRIPLIRKAFLSFSQSDAREFIVNSKINDKHSHLQALEKYQEMCAEQQANFSPEREQAIEIMVDGDDPTQRKLQ